MTNATPYPKEVVDLGVTGRNPRYLPTGHLVYGHESQALMAVRYDAEARRVIGEPTRVLPDVLVFGGGATQFDASRTGTIIYGQSGPSGGRRNLVTVDMDGLASPLPLGGGAYRTPRFSPDARRISYDMGDRIWVYDRDSGTNTALTTVGDTDYPAAWSPDGRNVYFASVRDGTLAGDVFRRPSDGSGSDEVLVRRDGPQYPLSSAPDGTTLLLQELTPRRGWDLLIASESGQDGWTVTDYLRADWNESMGAISPDGAWVAYVSDESGTSEVYVRSFPDAGNRHSVSQGGGSAPVWSPDGAAVYYLVGGRVMSAPLSSEGLGESRVLFEGGWATTGSIPMTNWDVHPDGRAFVFIRNPSTGAGRIPSGVPVVPVEIVVNWFTELRSQVGG